MFGDMPPSRFPLFWRRSQQIAAKANNPILIPMNCKTMKHCLAGTLLGASLLCGKVSATPVFVPDFSFENYTDPTTGNGLADGTASTGPDVGPSWSAAANNGVDLVNPTNAQFAGTTGAPGTLPPTGNGSNYLSIGAASPSYNGFCWQTITNFQANTVYTLTVAIGNTLFNDGGSGSINLLSGRFPGGTTFASAPVYAGSLSAGTFADSTLVFTTGQHGGSPLTIVLEALGGTGTQVIFDNVRL